MLIEGTSLEHPEQLAPSLCFGYGAWNHCLYPNNYTIYYVLLCLFKTSCKDQGPDPS